MIVQCNNGRQVTIIENFNYIYELAKCSKCQMFMLIKNSDSLFGGSDDCCCIHEIKMPFCSTVNLLFRTDSIDTELFCKYNNFILMDNQYDILIPDCYIDKYCNDELKVIYCEDKYVVIDNDNNIIEQLPLMKDKNKQIFMYEFKAWIDFDMLNFIKQVNGLIARFNNLLPGELFIDAHLDENIRNVFDSKVSIGRVMCRFTKNTTDVAFYMYKGLFSLAKADSLDILIRFDKAFPSKIFMASFILRKKKNPISSKLFNLKYQEYVHCLLINLI